MPNDYCFRCPHKQHGNFCIRYEEPQLLLGYTMQLQCYTDGPDLLMLLTRPGYWVEG